MVAEYLENNYDRVRFIIDMCKNTPLTQFAVLLILYHPHSILQLRDKAAVAQVTGRNPPRSR